MPHRDEQEPEVIYEFVSESPEEDQFNLDGAFDMLFEAALENLPITK